MKNSVYESKKTAKISLAMLHVSSELHKTEIIALYYLH